MNPPAKPAARSAWRKPVLLTLAVACALAAAAYVLRPGPRPPPCAALASKGAHEVDGRCVVDGNLTTDGYAGSQLPERLTVRGSLRVVGCGVPTLPAGLVVEKGLELYKTCVDTFPADLVVGGDVDVDLSFGDAMLACDRVPDSVRVGGYVMCE